MIIIREFLKENKVPIFLIKTSNKSKAQSLPIDINKSRKIIDKVFINNAQKFYKKFLSYYETKEDSKNNKLFFAIKGGIDTRLFNKLYQIREAYSTGFYSVHNFNYPLLKKRIEIIIKYFTKKKIEVNIDKISHYLIRDYKVDLLFIFPKIAEKYKQQIINAPEIRSRNFLVNLINKIHKDSNYARGVYDFDTWDASELTSSLFLFAQEYINKLAELVYLELIYEYIYKLYDSIKLSSGIYNAQLYLKRGKLQDYNPLEDSSTKFTTYIPKIGDLYYLGKDGKEYNIFDLMNNPVIEEKKEFDLHKFKEIKSLNIKLYTGGTGTGKTYTAIKEAAKNGRFYIAVPTRQLAYEIYMDYQEVSGVDTGEIHFDTNENKVVVYENLFGIDYKKENIKTLIIDEAHFLQDEQRGVDLLEQIYLASKAGCKIILLTATNSLSEELINLLNIREIELQPFKEVEKIQVEDWNEFRQIASQSKSVLVFSKYTPDQYTLQEYADKFNKDINKCGLIHAGIPTSERILTQIKFRKGELEMVVSTNVLAQGVNFPAECVYIEYNSWDSPEVIHQKIGRCGRPGYSDKGYYYLNGVPPIYKRLPKTETTRRRALFYGDIVLLDWEEVFMDFSVPPHRQVKEYSQFKYSKRFYETLIKKGYELNEQEKKNYQFLLDEERKLMSILQKYKSK